MIFEEKEHDKIFHEIIQESKDVKLLAKSYKFGIASAITSLHEWLDSCDAIEIKELTTNDIRKAFDSWSDDPELNELFLRLK